MKHETFKSIYPFLENALANFIEVLRHWVMWWIFAGYLPRRRFHIFFRSQERCFFSLFLDAPSNSCFQTANCKLLACEGQNTLPATSAHLRAQRGPKRGEHPVRNLRISKAYPEISHNQNDPVVVRETDLGGKHWWNGKKSGFFGNKIRWNKNMFNC